MGNENRGSDAGASPVAQGQAATTASHTPGPWTWDDRPGAGLQISATLPAGFQFDGTARGADGFTAIMIWTLRAPMWVQIADERWVQFETGSWSEMQRANARLIAAAPDLLKACGEALDALHIDPVDLEYGECEQIMRDARRRLSAAITRATEA